MLCWGNMLTCLLFLNVFFVFAVSGEFITVLLRVKFKRGAAKSLAEDTSELAEEDQTDQHEPTAA